jgi:hypothetical protein
VSESLFSLARLRESTWTITAGGYDGLRPDDAVKALIEAVQAAEAFAGTDFGREGGEESVKAWDRYVAAMGAFRV